MLTSPITGGTNKQKLEENRKGLFWGRGRGRRDEFHRFREDIREDWKNARGSSGTWRRVDRNDEKNKAKGKSSVGN